MRSPLSIRYASGSMLARSVGLLLITAGGSAWAAPVAGLAPHERPAGAPVIRQTALAVERTARLTDGVSRPLPKGLEFLKDQGAWYTPFGHPGMVSPYDLRDLRQLRSSSAGVGRSTE